MNFAELRFLPFLALVLLLHHALPWRLGRWVLLAASYLFYGAANPWYCLILLTSTLVDFTVARAMAEAEGARRRAFLIASLTTNLGLLGFFKYAHFVQDELGSFGLRVIELPTWVLPVGISFYTFQTLSYTIDVYRRRFEPTRDFGQFALYVAFFPQLVAGPIERAHRLLPQLAAKQPVTSLDVEEGVQRFLWGLVKKVVFADRLAVFVDEVYGAPEMATAPALVLGTLAFSFQIYLDFSAYTDMAIGLARLLGVRLSENFSWPFLATNPSDSWSRWHVTLTNWFRDYVFEPLGGMKRGRPGRTALAMLATMTLMGLWHGAAWNFVAFGLFSGVVLVGHLLLRVWWKRGPLLGRRPWSKPLAWLLLAPFIQVQMVFFRSPDLGTAWEVLSGVFTHEWRWVPVHDVALALVLTCAVAHAVRGWMGHAHRVPRLPGPLRGLLWLGMVLLVIYGAVDQTQPHVYFRF